MARAGERREDLAQPGEVRRLGLELPELELGAAQLRLELEVPFGSAQPCGSLHLARLPKRGNRPAGREGIAHHRREHTGDIAKAFEDRIFVARHSLVEAQG